MYGNKNLHENARIINNKKTRKILSERDYPVGSRFQKRKFEG